MYFLPLCPEKASLGNDNPVATMSILRPPNTVSYLREPEILGEMFDSRYGTENVHGKLGTSYL